MAEYRQDSSGSRFEPLVGSYEHGSETPGSVERWETVSFSRAVQNGSVGDPKATSVAR
jgi:hypothetical protein